jgi:hypothetical protein
MDRITIAIAFYLLPACLCAQWLDFKTPGIPRTADRKPDLTAPTLRTSPDTEMLEGVCMGPCL